MKRSNNRPKGIGSSDVVRVEPPSGLETPNLRELWQYRRLIACLARRDLQLRYRQTLAGIVWVGIQPLLSAFVLRAFFGHWLAQASSGAPYMLFVFCGLVPWAYFVHGLTVCTYSVVNDQSLVTKIWFPRMALPVAPALAGLADLAIAFVVLLLLMCRDGIFPHVSIFALPVFAAMAFVTTVAVALWLSALEVRYRDVAQALPFFAQLWFFATPVAYSADVVPSAWRWLYGLNPMVGVVNGFRWALLGTSFDGSILAVSVAVSFLVLIGGLYFFRAREVEFADVI